jgi:hypothetical protein
VNKHSAIGLERRAKFASCEWPMPDLGAVG